MAVLRASAGALAMGGVFAATPLFERIGPDWEANAKPAYRQTEKAVGADTVLKTRKSHAALIDVPVVGTRGFIGVSSIATPITKAHQQIRPAQRRLLHRRGESSLTLGAQRRLIARGSEIALQSSAKF